MRGFPLVLVCLALLAPASLRAAAPPPAAGPNFQVNEIGGGAQFNADVAEDASGDTVYVWIDQFYVPQAVVARLFTPQGDPQGFNIVVEFDNQALSPPHVAMTPQGEFVVAWSNLHTVFLKRFDRLGRPLGNGTTTQQPTSDLVGLVDVAVDPAGDVAVVWQVSGVGGDTLYLQRFDAANQARTAPFPVSQSSLGDRTDPRVVFGADGSLLVSWDDFRTGALSDVWARRFDGPTGAWAPEFRVNDDEAGYQQGSAPLLDPSGAGAVVYSDFTQGRILVRQVSPAGTPVGTSIPLGQLGSVGRGSSAPDAARGPDGTTLVVWEANDLLAHARFFDRSWNPLTEDFLVSSPHDDVESDPAVAANPAGGGFAVAWTSDGRIQGFPGPVPQVQDGRDGSLRGIFAQRFQDPLCAAGSETLCLDGGRFQAQVSWKNPYTGETGTGKALPLTGDTGAFWFFDAKNLELMLKMIDGRAVNGYFWMYYGSLSNVEYTLTIRDTLLGTEKSYHNAPFQLASRSDIQAFVSPVIDPPPPAAARTAAPPAAGTAAKAAADPQGDCAPAANALCLDQGRFEVQVDFTDPRNGAGGPARAVPLTDDSGSFWFFSPENLEVMIKVLDGRPVNGRFWVFYGSLSDVAYTVTVTDTVTRQQRVYHNTPGHQSSVADTLAFPPTAGIP